MKTKTGLVAAVRGVMVSGAFGLAAAMCLVPGAVAQPAPQAAQGKLGAMEDGMLERMQVTRVQPVVYSHIGARTEMAGVMWRAGQVKATSAQRARLAVPELASASPSEDGLGFGGSATELDTMSLRYGHVLGLLPLLHAVNPSQFKVTVAQLGQLGALEGEFGAQTRGHIQAFVADAQRGKINSDAYLGMMQGCVQDIAGASDASVERRHGYLLLGLWSGLALTSAESDAVTTGLVSSGRVLIELLEEDAAYGGADRSLANLTRAMTDELAQATPSDEVLAQLAQRMMAVRAD
jgi:hypothetical protein